jgi:hypothetical protein
MMKLANSLGAIGLEKLLSNLGHRNARVREQILHTVVGLLDVYNRDISAMPDICSRVSVLLGRTLSFFRILSAIFE